LVELRGVECSQLWARKTVNDVSNGVVQQARTASDVTHKTSQDVREQVLGSLEGEALEVVALKQSSAVEDATGQVVELESGESVYLTGVATDIQELRVLLGGSNDIGQEEGDGVFVADGAFVPVVWDLLVALGVDEVARLAGDGEEGLENTLVEDTFWVLLGLVAHEAVDKGVGGGLHQDTGEGAVEEVGVLVDGLVEAGRTERSQDAQVVVCGGSIGLGVEHLLELADDHLIIIAAGIC
jgi:hypothetical protein